MSTITSTVATQTSSSSPSTTSSSSPSAASSSSSSPSPTPAPSSSSSTTTTPTTHTVTVGAGSFKYEPDSIKANVGDTVSFEFYPPDHSVARAEYGNPCVPYEYTGKGKQGFWSGTQWVNNTNEITHWSIIINSTEPIFYYCAAPNSCIDKLMVGAINPNSTQTLDAQIKAAGKAQFALAPGDPVPNEASSTLSNAPTASSTTTSTSSNDTRHHSLSGGVIAGIVVGSVAFLVLCAALFFYVGRTKSLKEVMNRKDATATSHPPGDPYAASQYPGSPGFVPPGSPFSPNMQQAEYGGQLPVYGQHHVADAHPMGWTNSPHNSMGPVQMAEVKDAYSKPVELASPPLQQQGFTAELEAPGAKRN